MNLNLYYNIDVDTDRRLVISKIYGIWKEETAREYHDDYVELVQPLLKDKWAKLTYLTNWKSSYPEIIEIIGDHLRWCHKNNAVYSLYVIENPVTTNQLKKMVEKGNARDVVRIFRTAGEAEKFLVSQGF